MGAIVARMSEAKSGLGTNVKSGPIRTDTFIDEAVAKLRRLRFD